MDMWRLRILPFHYILFVPKKSRKLMRIFEQRTRRAGEAQLQTKQSVGFSSNSLSKISDRNPFFILKIQISPVTFFSPSRCEKRVIDPALRAGCWCVRSEQWNRGDSKVTRIIKSDKEAWWGPLISADFVPFQPWQALKCYPCMTGSKKVVFGLEWQPQRD